MTKAELIAALAEKCGATQREAEVALDGLAAIASHELALGETVTIPGVVKLTPKERPARPGRNPRTGEAIEVPAKTVVTAKVVPSLAKALA